jgi:hypothetical protein
MKEKCPRWYKRFWGEAFTNKAISELTTLQRGMLEKLIDSSCREDEFGTLPVGDKELAKMAGVDERTWIKHKAPVLKSFDHRGDRLIVPIIRDTANEYRQRQAAGFEAAGRRWKNGDAYFAKQRSAGSAAQRRAEVQRRVDRMN